MLFCFSRVHERGADGIGWYDIYVKTELLTCLKVLPTYLRLLDVFPSHNYCLDIF